MAAPTRSSTLVAESVGFSGNSPDNVYQCAWTSNASGGTKLARCRSNSSRSRGVTACADGRNCSTGDGADFGVLIACASYRWAPTGSIDADLRPPHVGEVRVIPAVKHDERLVAGAVRQR